MSVRSGRSPSQRVVETGVALYRRMAREWLVLLARARVRAGAERPFSLQHRGSDRHVPVVGVPVAVARRCRLCDGHGVEDFHRVTVYRVSEPMPWWLTVEIHCCSAGHSEFKVRATRGWLRPARRSAPQVLGNTSPTPRTFEMASLFGLRRASLSATGILAGLDCRICGRPCGVTAYQVSADNTIPAWLGPIELNWCDVCTSAELAIDTDYRPVELVASS